MYVMLLKLSDNELGYVFGRLNRTTASNLYKTSLTHSRVLGADRFLFFKTK